MNSWIHGDAFYLLEKIEPSTVDCLLTDPPYNVARKVGVIRLEGRKDINEDLVSSDWDKIEDFVKWLRAWIVLANKTLKKNSSIFIFMGDQYAYNVRVIGEELGWNFQNYIIWYKTNAAPMFRKSARKFSSSYEMIIYFQKGKPTFNWLGGICMRNVQEGPFPMPRQRYNHPTQKPIWLIKRLIKVATKKGDLVLDPFGGVATTAFCCKQLERKCISFEKEEKYYKSGKDRLEELDVTTLWDL